MKHSFIFGSHARGDFNNKSDFDVLLINMAEEEFDYSIVPSDFIDKIDFVQYSLDEFYEFYNRGSLFLYHILDQGVHVQGCKTKLQNLKEEFVVQKDFSEEIGKIYSTSKLLSKTIIFGGKYLTPMSNLYIELKNSCIFYLAHNGVYEFNKSLCMKKAIPESIYDNDLDELKHFYDLVVRGIKDLPFDANDKYRSEKLINTAIKSIEWIENDCCQ